MSQRAVTTPSAAVNVMAKAAFKAAKGLIRDFGEVEHLQVTRKGPGDFVSIADRHCEKILQEELSKSRPGVGFLMEESGEIEGNPGEGRWIIDPLDGTTNFLHSIPHFAISIALQKEQEIVAGIVYDPLKDELFWAEKGMGAFMNDRRLRVSSRRQLPDALLATGIPFAGRGDVQDFLKKIDVIMPLVAGIRRLGAAALDLAYVAAGRFDGYWEKDLAPWDIAAGMLLVKEAGGTLTDFLGKRDTLSILNTGGVIAGNEFLSPTLMKLLR